MKNESQISKIEDEPVIEIITATPEDIEGMQEVFYKTWLATYPNKDLGITIEDIEDQFKDRHSEKRLAEMRERILQFSNRITLVAKEEGRIIGLCRVVKREDKNQLQAIYVLPEYQGRAIGKSLWQEAQKFLDSKKDTTVELASYNDNAIAFYKKLGFKDTGKRYNNERFTMKSGAVIPEMEMIKKADDQQQAD